MRRMRVRQRLYRQRLDQLLLDVTRLHPASLVLLPNLDTTNTARFDRRHNSDDGWSIPKPQLSHHSQLLIVLQEKRQVLIRDVDLRHQYNDAGKSIATPKSRAVFRGNTRAAGAYLQVCAQLCLQLLRGLTATERVLVDLVYPRSDTHQSHDRQHGVRRCQGSKHTGAQIPPPSS